MAMRGGRGGRPLTEEEKLNAPKISFPLLKRCFGYLWPYWPRLVFVFLCIIVSSWLAIQPTVITGRIIDEGLDHRNLDMVIKLVALCFGVMILSSLIDVLQSWLNTWIAQHITFDMRNKMYAHLIEQSQRFFATTKQGDAITRMTSDIGSVQSVISGTLTGLVQNIASVIIALVTMLQISPMLAFIGMLIVPFLIIPTKFVGKKRWEITYQAQAKNDTINQLLSETMSVSGQMLVKLFGREASEINKYEQTNQEMTNLNIKESMAGRWFRFTMGVITSSGPMIIYLIGGILMIRYSSDITTGNIVVMVGLLSRLYGPVNSLFNMQVDITRSMAIFTRIFEYYDMEPEIISKPDAMIPEKFYGNIQYKDVCFEYDPGVPILKDISFYANKGRSIAIVGPSGSGKSTIINLIPRLYDVTSGNITLDGNDIRDLDLHWLRGHIGIVSQDTYLFNDTIRANLLYAKFDASDDELIEACKKANIHDFIAGQPDGYNTQVGNRGVKLSGGERQRLSMARVILKDPGLIILDEATSALDSITEHSIQDAIEPLLKGKTSLVIAHRLSTIMACDEILVVKAGMVVEHGKHDELLAYNGVYRELYETQYSVMDPLED